MRNFWRLVIFVVVALLIGEGGYFFFLFGDPMGKVIELSRFDPVEKLLNALGERTGGRTRIEEALDAKAGVCHEATVLPSAKVELLPARFPFAEQRHVSLVMLGCSPPSGEPLIYINVVRLAADLIVRRHVGAPMTLTLIDGEASIFSDKLNIDIRMGSASFSLRSTAPANIVILETKERSQALLTSGSVEVKQLIDNAGVGNMARPTFFQSAGWKMEIGGKMQTTDKDDEVGLYPAGFQAVIAPKPVK